MVAGPWFEEAPPLLPYYLGRLPAKSFGQIFLETTPSPKETPAPDFTEALMTLDNRITKTDRPKLIAEVDRLLVAAREHYENGNWCNLLHDVRDVLSSRASNDEAADYIQWRIGNAKAFFISEEKDQSSDDPSEKADITKSKLAKDLEARAASAPKLLRPHWLYLRGALGFSRWRPYRVPVVVRPRGAGLSGSSPGGDRALHERAVRLWPLREREGG